MKKSVLVINPKSVEIMKAIYNILVIDALDIIILGNRDYISYLCSQINLNINLLQIIECENEEKISDVIKTYKSIKSINGIIVDGFRYEMLYELFKYREICNIVDFGIFKKSCFLVKNAIDSTYKKNIEETIKLIRSINLNSINTGIVCIDKQKGIMKKKWLKKEFNLKNVDIINKDKIKKCKYNLIVFDDRLTEIEYLNKISSKVLPKVTEINKASNIIIFDANGKVFKNIFLQFMFLSKTSLLNNQINTQAI